MQANDTYWDGPHFYDVANNIYKGGIFEADHSLWPMGWPLLIRISFIFLGVGSHSAIFLSAFLGSLTVVVVYLMAKELFDERVALMSALLAAISPVHVHLGMTMMADSAGMFFLVFSTYLFLRYTKTRAARYLVATSICFGIAMLIKFISFFLIPFFVLWEIWVNRRSLKRLTGIYARKGFVVSILVLFLILSPQMYYNTMKYGKPYQTKFSSTHPEGTFSLRNLITGGNLSYPISPLKIYPHHIFYTYRILPPFLTLFYLIGFAALLKRNRGPLFFLVSWMLLYIFPMMCYVNGTLDATRYAVFIMPMLAILGSYGISITIKTLFPKDEKILLAIVSIAALSTLMHTYWWVNDKIESDELDERVYNWVNENTEYDAIVLARATIFNQVERGAVKCLDLKDGLTAESIPAYMSEEKPIYFITEYPLHADTPCVRHIVENYDLTLVRREIIHLSSTSPKREYGKFVYRIAEKQR